MKYQVERRYDAINDRDVYIPQPAPGEYKNTREISEVINECCTVSPPDVVAVVLALEMMVARELGRGNSVRLGMLGSFSVTMQAKASERAEDVQASDVTRVGVRFCPSRELKQLLNSARIELA